MTTKEMTAHLRGRIKAAGIKARVHFGSVGIYVEVSRYELDFTDDEQRTIRRIAKCSGLTHVRGLEIDVEQMTDPKLHLFVISSR